MRLQRDTRQPVGAGRLVRAAGSSRRRRFKPLLFFSRPSGFAARKRHRRIADTHAARGRLAPISCRERASISEGGAPGVHQNKCAAANGCYVNFCMLSLKAAAAFYASLRNAVCARCLGRREPLASTASPTATSGCAAARVTDSSDAGLPLCARHDRSHCL